MNNIWKQFGNTPMDYSMVASLFPNHKCKHNKVSALEKKGDIIRLKQGLYVPNPDLSVIYFSSIGIEILRIDSGAGVYNMLDDDEAQPIVSQFFGMV